MEGGQSFGEMFEDSIAAVAWLLHKLIVVAGFLFEFNYTLVSWIIRFICGFVELVHTTFVGLYFALSDFVDQYGELCWTLLSGIAYEAEQAYCGIVRIVTKCANCVDRILIGIIELPNTFETVAEQVSVSAHSVVRYTQDFFKGFTLLFSGLGMIFSGIWKGATWVVTKTYTGFVVTLEFFISILLSIARSCFYVLLTPARWTFQIGRHIFRTPQEVIFGLVILVAIAALWQYGCFDPILQWIRRVTIKIIQNCVSFWLGLIEWILTLYFPFFPILVRIWKIVYRPIFRIVRWMYRLLTGRRKSDAESPVKDYGRSKLHSPKDKREREEKLTCIVCYDGEKTMMIEPCRHMCLCGNCASRLRNERRMNQKCPMCRSQISDIVNVYL